MLERVHDVAIRAQCGPVVVLTDDDEVAEVVRCFGGEVWLTDAGHESGTARIASVAARLSGEVVVNLQGDAPLIDPAVVARTAEEAAGSGAAVTMPVYPLRDEADVLDPNVVKVVRGRDGRVLYCSRSAIPFRRDGGASYWGHAGLYAYTRAFLEAFESLPASELEDAERLEQLRWLEAGVRAHSFAVDYQQPSVDTAADLERIRSLLAGTKAVPV
jgi:3-deoxy-manno-octulosonate cytidylyltransferase (CMP-KDO synthetase)